MRTNLYPDPKLLYETSCINKYAPMRKLSPLCNYEHRRKRVRVSVYGVWVWAYRHCYLCALFEYEHRLKCETHTVGMRYWRPYVTRKATPTAKNNSKYNNCTIRTWKDLSLELSGLRGRNSKNFLSICFSLREKHLIIFYSQSLKQRNKTPMNCTKK